MSQMVGADVAELRALAATFEGSAAQLGSIDSQVSWRIHSAPWHGADVSRFQHDWTSVHRRSIANAATSLAAAAQVLRANADQQELASDATYGGRVPAVGQFLAGRPDGAVDRVDDRGWITRVLDLTESVPWRIVSAADTIHDAAETGVEMVEKWGAKGTLVEKFLQAAPEELTTLGKVGRWLGPVGMVVDGLEFGNDLRHGDGWGMALSAASFAVTGVATLAAFGLGGALIVGAAPALAVGAAVVGLASLAYHEREAIGKFAGAVGGTVAKAGAWAADRAVDLGRSLVQGAADGARTVADTAGGIARSVTEAGRNFVDGIFRKPAWTPW